MDLAVAVDDAATPDLIDPMTYWLVHKSLGIATTIIPATASDLAECWGEPNTLGYDLTQDARRLDVGP